jgi:hypothetical protein
MKVTHEYTGVTVQNDVFWYKILGLTSEGLKCSVWIRGGKLHKGEQDIVWVTTELEPEDWGYSEGMLPELALMNARRFAHETWGGSVLSERSTDARWEERMEKLNGLYS